MAHFLGGARASGGRESGGHRNCSCICTQVSIEVLHLAGKSEIFCKASIPAARNIYLALRFQICAQ